MRRRFQRHALPGVAAIVGAVALLVAACGGNGPAGGSGSGLAADQVFNYNLPNAGSSDLATLDPDIVQDTSSYGVIMLVFDGLVTQDPHLNVENWGAQKIDVSPDGVTYTFHLRPGQPFSDGTPVTAQDYAYSMERAVNPCLASPVSYYLFPIKDAATLAGEKCSGGTIGAAAGQTTPVVQSLIGDSIHTPDANTLVVTLAKPAAYFLQAMTYPVTYALNPRVVGSDVTSEKWLDTLGSGQSGASSGMYYVASWNHNSGTLDLKQNPHWWGLAQGKKPHLTEIKWTIFKSQDTSYAAYRSGQFEVGFPPPQQLAQAKSQQDYHQTDTLTYYGINFNWKQSPFNNPDARAAFCLAVNHDALVSAILHGQGTATWSIVPKGMPGYAAGVSGPDGVTSTRGDPARARQLWEAYLKTLDGKPAPAISYLYSTGSAARLQYAQALQAQWSQVLGANVALKGEDFNSYVADDDAGNFVVTRFAWADDYPDPQDFLTLLFSTGAQYNSQGASVPQADDLMHRADQTANQAQRLRMYDQAQQQLIDQVATCPVYQELYPYEVRSYVKGWSIAPSVETPLDTWVATYLTNH